MQPIIVLPGDGNEVTAFGDTILFKVVGDHTENNLSIGLATTPPGNGPPLHVHLNDNEVFIMISGDIEVEVGGEWKKAPPESVVFLPKGVPHRYRNAGETTSKHWVLVTPSGFENFFQQCSAVFAAGGAPDFAQIKAISADHNVEILGPPPGAH